MIKIVDYQENWLREFDAIAKRLRQGAGDAILAIHHIGSTAVHGLAAKYIIDIQITVARLSDHSEKAIEKIGFTLGSSVADHCPPGRSLPADQLAKRFYKYSERPAHIHVREAGRFNHRYPLLCRDYLRNHADAARAYEEIKRQLATRFALDKDSYYAIKDPMFDLLMVGAEAWATETNWQLPPSDG